jgi:alanine racemase
MTGSSMLLNAVDPGAALFSPLLADESDDGYQPFRSLKSRLIQVKDAHRTEFLEEAPFKIAPGMRTGIVPIGYSDGMHRLNCGEVLVHGQRVPLLGSPALEYTRIDWRECPVPRLEMKSLLSAGRIQAVSVLKKSW